MLIEQGCAYEPMEIGPTPEAEEQLTLFSRIGFGAHAAVYSGLMKGDKCAIKCILPSEPTSAQSLEAYKKDLYAESGVLSSLSHPNIVSLLKNSSRSTFTDPYGVPFTTDFSVIEVLEGGELLSFADREPLSEDEIRYYAAQVIDALCYLHSKGLVHRDVKAENIVLTGDLTTAKLIDFEYSVKTSDFPTAVRKGTMDYQPPESLCLMPQDGEKADVFALGVTLCLLATGRFPCGREYCTQADGVYRLLCARRYGEFWKKVAQKISLSDEFKLIIQTN